MSDLEGQYFKRIQALEVERDQLREEVKNGDVALEELRTQNLRIAKEAHIAHKHIQDMQVTNGSLTATVDKLKAELERLNTGKRKPLRCLRHPDDLCQFCEICETCFQKLTDGSDHWKSVAGKMAEQLRTIEALNNTGHYIEGEPGHENKGCVASDIAEAALAQYNASRGEEGELCGQ